MYPACGCKESAALGDVTLGRRARPGPYQCPNRECRFQFAVDDPNAAAFDQAAAPGLADWPVAHSAVG